MTIFANGYEEGDFTAWTGTSGTPEAQNVTKHHGSISMKCDSSDYSYKNFAGGANTYARCYMLFESMPSGNFDVFQVSFGAHYVFLRCLLSVDHWHWYINCDGGISGTSAGTISTGQWYCLEFKVISSTSVDLYVDGVSVITLNIAGRAGNGATVYVGGWGKPSASTNYADCVVVDSSYIGPEVAVSVKRGSGVVGAMMAFINSRMVE